MSTGLHFPTYCDEHHDLIRDFGAPRPEIVVLCGSTRFHDEFQQANYDLTMGGAIVLAPGVWVRSSPAFADLPEGQQAEAKRALDELHKRKIDLADRVFVVNVGGYIGESTRSEIAYAEALGKPIDYLESAKPYQIAETKAAGWALRCEVCDITKAGMTQEEARRAYQRHLKASHSTVELHLEPQS